MSRNRPSGAASWTKQARSNGRIPELTRQLDQHDAKLAKLQKGEAMLKEEVTEEDIAEVVSSWTGIPVSNLREGEREKLPKMEERLAKRVVGQKPAIVAVSNAVRRARRAAGGDKADRLHSFSSGRRAWEKRN